MEMKKKFLFFLFFLIPFISFAEVKGYDSFRDRLTYPVFPVQLTAENSQYSAITNFQINYQGVLDNNFVAYLLCDFHDTYGNFKILDIVYYLMNGTNEVSFSYKSSIEYQCPAGGITIENDNLSGTNDWIINWNYSIGTSSPIMYGYTQGELTISFFLSIILMAGIFSFIINHLVDKRKKHE